MQKRREKVEKWREERKIFNGNVDRVKIIEKTIEIKQSEVKESTWSLDKDEDEGDEEEQSIEVVNDKDSKDKDLNNETVEET